MVGLKTFKIKGKRNENIMVNIEGKSKSGFLAAKTAFLSQAIIHLVVASTMQPERFCNRRMNMAVARHNEQLQGKQCSMNIGGQSAT